MHFNKELYIRLKSVCVCVSHTETTFSTLHALNEDPSTVGKDPVPTAVTVLSIHHGTQGMGYFKQLSSGLMMLLQWYDDIVCDFFTTFWSMHLQENKTNVLLQ